jgi:acyl-CoA thioester hydrolase
MPAFAHKLRVRYHECDAQGVVFNANHFAYFDIGITELWREAFGSYQALLDEGTDVVVADAQASFYAPVHFDEEIELLLTIVRLGYTSMTTEIEEHRGSEVLVTGKLVHVFVDPKTMKKRRIPDHVKERLEPWALPAPPVA